MRRLRQARTDRSAGQRPRRAPRSPIAVVTAVVTALIAGMLTITVAPATVAHAGLSNPIPLNGAEEPTDAFTDADALFVAVLSDIKGGTVCVVSAAVTSPGGGSCKHPAWGSPNNIVGLGTVIQPIEAPPLRIGTWKLLSEDTSGNGVGLSDVFSVDACVDCSRELAAAALGPWKLTAEQNVIGATATCTVMTILNKFDSARNLEWSTGGVTMVSVGLGIGGGFTFAVADPFEASQAKAKEILRELVCKVQKMYEDIANDPPRPDFQIVQPAVIGPVDPLTDPLEQTLANSMALQVGHGRASLADYERYLGAVLGGSSSSAISQLQAASDETFGLVDAVTDASTALDAYAASIDADPTLSGPLFATQADLDLATTAYTRVRTTGFTGAELLQLQSLGLTSTEIDTLRLNLGVDMSAVTLSTTPGDSLRSLAAAFRGSLDAYDMFGREAAAVSARRALDTPVTGTPIASFTADPLTGEEPLQVAFDGSASTGGSGVVNSYAWDFGDGSSTNGQTTTHTFAAGTYTVTLTVTDVGGGTASTSQVITATNSTVPPNIFQPPARRVSVGAAYPYDVIANTVTASQSMTFAYDFGDGTPVQTTTGNGAAGVDHTYSTPGVYDLKITVTNAVGVSNTIHVAVTAGSPVADAGPDQSSNEGSEVQLFGANTSPDDIHTLSKWDFGDGSVSFGVIGLHTYADDGIYTATLTVTDGTSGETATDTAQVTVANVAPTAKGMAYIATPQPGEVASFRAFGADVGVNDVLSATWTFGDGTTAVGMIADHPYGAPGDYVVAATISDGDGGQTSLSRTVHVGPRVGVSDSKGREHWLVFQTNYVSPPLITINIAAEEATSGEVEVPGIGFRQAFTVAPGQVTAVTLPPETAQQVASIFGDLESKSVHVVADKEVTVYGLNRVEFTTDAFLGLPRDVLGKDHVIASYASTQPSEISVGAPYNDTTLTIDVVGDVNGSVPGPHVFHLDAGDTIQIQGVDLTGSRVTSDKPVSVYGGVQCANVPQNITFCDHITEQMPSTDLLGSRFVTVPLATRLGGDTFRVVATQANTTVNVNGQDVATIGTGEFYETLLDTPSIVLTSHPAVLAQYSNGTSFDGVVADPFMMLVPPAEQYLPSYTVSTPAAAILSNFINLVAPTTALDSVRVDGQPVDPTVWVPVPGASFSAAQLTVELGSHTIAAAQPLGVFVYGFDSFDSYGYPGGFQLARIGAVATITVEPATQTLAVGTQACVTATVNDASGFPVADVRVDHTIAGANIGDGFGFSSANGTVPICWTGAAAGLDTVKASVGNTSGTATVTFTDGGQPVNRAPIADAKSVTTAEDTPLGVTLTATDPDGDPVSFTVITSPAHGSLTGSGASRTYSPAPNYFGPDSFTYRADDGILTSNTATVSITVTPVNDPPVAVDASVTTAEDTPTGVTLTAVDVDIDPLTFSIVTGPAHGTLTGTGAGRTYTPDPNYFGPDAFTFTANDGTVDSNVATESITVTPVNDPPVADPKSVTTAEDTPVGITLSGSDIEGSALTFLATSPAHGTLTGTGASRTYTPDANYFGLDSFTYRVNDSSIDSEAAIVTITVTPVNDAPVAAPKSETVAQDATVLVGLTGTDVDGDALTFSVVTSPAHGTLVGTGATRTYTPSVGFFGPDSFTYVANDGTIDSNVATVTITVTPVNHAPTADSQSVTTDEDTPIEITLTGADQDGDAITFAVVDGPAHGTFGATGAIRTYAPAANFFGADSFTFRTNDGALSSALATVSITITPVNDPPVVSIQVGTPRIEGTAVQLQATASDVDGDAVAFAWSVTSAALDPGGSCSLSATTGALSSVTCTDDGTAEINLGGNDGTTTATTSASVIVTNVAPVVKVRPIAAPGTAPASVTVTADVTDDGSNDTATCAINFGNGVTTTVAVVAGVCTATTTVTAAGSFTATVTATDDDGGQGSGTAGYTVASPPPATCITVLGEGYLTSVLGTWKLELDDYRAPFDKLVDTIEVSGPGRLKREYLVATVTVVGNTATIVSRPAKDGTRLTAVVIDNGPKDDRFSVDIVDLLNRVKATTGGLHTVTRDGFTVAQRVAGTGGTCVVSTKS